MPRTGRYDLEFSDDWSMRPHRAVSGGDRIPNLFGTHSTQEITAMELHSCGMILTMHFPAKQSGMERTLWNTRMS